MGVEDAFDIWSGIVDSGVECEAGQVGAIGCGAVVDDVAYGVELDERGRGDLVVEEAKGVDQELVLLLADTGLEFKKR